MIHVILRRFVLCLALFGLSACADLSSSINVNNAAIIDIVTIQANNELLARDYFKVNGYDLLDAALETSLNGSLERETARQRERHNRPLPPAVRQAIITIMLSHYEEAVARIKKSEDEYLAAMRGNYGQVTEAMRTNSAALTKMNSGFKLGTVMLQVGKGLVGAALPSLAPIISAFKTAANGS